MKFYQTPGGRLSTAEKTWKAHMQEEGIDPKTYKGRKTFDVPTKGPELMEFLSFHNVNVVNPHPASDAVPAAPPVLQTLVAPSTTVPNMDELFEALPLAQQLHLGALALENARAKIR